MRGGLMMDRKELLRTREQFLSDHNELSVVTLRRHNDNFERVRDDAAPRVRLGCGRRQWLSELRRYQKNSAGRCVKGHRAGSLRRLDGLKSREASLICIHNRERPVASIRRKCQTMLRIEASSIGRITNRGQTQNFS